MTIVNTIHHILIKALFWKGLRKPWGLLSEAPTRTSGASPRVSGFSPVNDNG
jgi:hypothetical protein